MSKYFVGIEVEVDDKEVAVDLMFQINSIFEYAKKVEKKSIYYFPVGDISEDS